MRAEAAARTARRVYIGGGDDVPASNDVPRVGDENNGACGVKEEVEESLRLAAGK